MNPIPQYLRNSFAAMDWLSLLLDATVKSSVILLCVFLVLGVCRCASASTRHWVWLLAMLSLLLLPLRLTRSPMLAIPVWTSRAAHGSQNELAAVVGPATSKLTQITRSQAQPLKPSVLS